MNKSSNFPCQHHIGIIYKVYHSDQDDKVINQQLDLLCKIQAIQLDRVLYFCLSPNIQSLFQATNNLAMPLFEFGLLIYRLVILTADRMSMLASDRP